jgi:hypothetical protein
MRTALLMLSVCWLIGSVSAQEMSAQDCAAQVATYKKHIPASKPKLEQFSAMWLKDHAFAMEHCMVADSANLGDYSIYAALFGNAFAKRELAFISRKHLTEEFLADDANLRAPQPSSAGPPDTYSQH